MLPAPQREDDRVNPSADSQSSIEDRKGACLPPSQLLLFPEVLRRPLEFPGPLDQFGAAVPSPEPYPSISMIFTISWLSVSMTTTVPARALSPRSYRGV